jgi:hypothetical protein
MSTLSNFRQLELQKKSELIWEWGFYLGSIKTGDYNVVYFLLNNFFVEMQVRLSDNVTESISAEAELSQDILSQLQYRNPLAGSLHTLNRPISGGAV